MKLLTSPDGAYGHAHNYAQGSANYNRGYSLLCHSQQFIDPVTGY